MKCDFGQCATRAAGGAGRRAIIMTVAIAAGFGCNESDSPPVHLTIGPPIDARVTFRPVHGFAEYVELPGHRNELRITLPSYEASCDDFVLPAEGETVVSIVVATPPGDAPRAGTYAWGGVGAVGSEQHPTHAFARPSARIGTRSHHLQPGGSVELTEVRLGAAEPRVTGLLAFEFPGDAEHPASSLRGRFTAAVCHARR